MKKICVITGSRAEYDLLAPVMSRVQSDPEMRLQILATGMHLSVAFGLTYKKIEADGFTIDEKVEVQLDSDTADGMAYSTGLAVIGISSALGRLKPDLVVVLGDRFEILAAAVATTIHNIPIAHIHGGELTLGAVDDAFRHSITKMARLHFASAESYRKRIIQLGECPDSVFNVGALGVENIKNIALMSLEQLSNSIGFDLGERYAVVTFHPETVAAVNSEETINNIIGCLERVEGMKILFTKANADKGGHGINRAFQRYVELHPHKSILVDSLGQQRYFSAVKYASVVIGNSSSGIIEVPSFGVPTINVGDRQLGRIMPASVIQCNTELKSISGALIHAFSDDFRQRLQDMRNPYEGDGTASTIVTLMKNALNNGITNKKLFYDIKEIQ